MDQKRVEELVKEALELNDSLFLIELSFLADNKVYVEVDGDNGVSLEECIRISRNIEHNLDREIEDFSLDVTTPDITKPLKVKRQYKKNIGRTMKVKSTDGNKYEGVLTEVTDSDIVLTWKSREPKPVGKGKVTVQKEEKIVFENIQEAIVKILFN